MTPEEAEAIVGKVASELGEHFDAVQVLVSWNENTESSRTYVGCGNWFARVGMAHDFLSDSDHEELATRLADAISDKEDWDDDDNEVV